MRKGEPIGVSAELNQNTNFAKLKVGKNIVTARKKKGSKDPLLPLTIALNDLNPLSKVQVYFEPQPKNTFTFYVNGSNVHDLVMEQLEYDPSKTEEL